MVAEVRAPRRAVGELFVRRCPPGRVGDDANLNAATGFASLPAVVATAKASDRPNRRFAGRRPDAAIAIHHNLIASASRVIVAIGTSP